MNKRNIFEQARGITDQLERDAYVRKASGDDEALRLAVEALLNADRNDGFLERPLAECMDQADPLLGTRIGPFKVLQRIGEGGFGVVYMAEQRSPMTRKVALKIIKAGMDTRQVIARFESERQALALMEHPNIARVLETGETSNGRPYFVMELVRGIPVTQFCKEENLPLRERLTLFVAICSAIQHAHQKGIVHRDLKPSNVLVTLNDGAPMPKIIDFGIAKALGFRLTERTLFTQFEQFLGTPAYMSPEQTQLSNQDVDTRSDIYSLGVLLYELLTGTPPFDPKSLQTMAREAMLQTIREVTPPKPSTRVTQSRPAKSEEPIFTNNEIPNDLDTVTMKALAKDRQRRYQTALAFAQDVQRFLNHEPVTATRPSSLYLASKWVQRNRGAAAACLAVSLAMLVGLIATYHQVKRASERGLAARKSFYLADMRLAQEALRSGNTDRARTILDRQVPATGEPDLRSWEWRYFWGLAHRERFHLIADEDPTDTVGPDNVYEVAISPQSDLLASASRNGMVRVWDLPSLKQRFQFQVPAKNLAWVDFSPNGQYLAAGGAHWGDVKEEDAAMQSVTIVIDVAEGRESHRLSVAPLEANECRFVSEQMLCIAAGNDLCFWDLVSNERETIDGHDVGIATLSVNLRKKLLATSDMAGHVKLWDFEMRQVLHEFEGVKHGLSLTSFSPDGNLLALGPFHMPSIAVYDTSTGNQVADLNLDFPNHGSCFSHDGAHLITTEFTGAMRWFQTSDWKEVGRNQHWGHQLNTVAVAPSGDLAVSGGDGGSLVGWLGNPSKPTILQSQGWMVTSVAYSPDNRLLATGTGDGRLEIWDAERGTPLHASSPQTSERTLPPPFYDDFYAFSPDSRRLAVAYGVRDTFSVRLLNTNDFAMVDELAHSAPVSCLQYSPDGRYLATGTGMPEGVIRIWDLASRQVIRSLPGHEKVVCLAFSPDASTIVSEAWSNVDGLWVWDVNSGEKIAILKGHAEGINKNHHGLRFSPNGALLASSGYDRQVILWDTQTWEPVRRLLGHEFLLYDLSFSHDGRRLASSGADNTCRVWDVDSGQEVASFRGYAIDFSPDGHTLAVGGALDFSRQYIEPDLSTIRIHRAQLLGAIDR